MSQLSRECRPSDFPQMQKKGETSSTGTLIMAADAGCAGGTRV